MGRAKPFRAYCRPCDKAVDATGHWPGRCTECAQPVEEAPVPDVLGPGLRLLLVGINPGVQTARTKHHFANPRNLFWGLLQESGLTPRQLDPTEERELLRWGMGVTNVVTRATPGAGDVTAEDKRRGRERLEALVRKAQPEWFAFVGKQAWLFAGGAPGQPFGVVKDGFWGRKTFVLPSPSPANAAIPRTAQLKHWKRLAAVAGTL